MRGLTDLEYEVLGDHLVEDCPSTEHLDSIDRWFEFTADDDYEAAGERLEVRGLLLERPLEAFDRSTGTWYDGATWIATPLGHLAYRIEMAFRSSEGVKAQFETKCG